MLPLRTFDTVGSVIVKSKLKTRSKVADIDGPVMLAPLLGMKEWFANLLKYSENGHGNRSMTIPRYALSVCFEPVLRGMLMYVRILLLTIEGRRDWNLWPTGLGRVAHPTAAARTT